MVEDMLAYRGIIVTHKMVREWTEKFGRDYANTICRRTPRLDDKWFLDEAVITIKGKHHILWRAVDQHGFVLDILVQKRRNTKAAKRFMHKLLSGHGYSLRVMVTDKLGSYGAGKRELGFTVCDHRQHKELNYRAENSHPPLRLTRAGHETFQVSAICAKVHINPRSSSQSSLLSPQKIQRCRSL